jgi:hypothetical protein
VVLCDSSGHLLQQNCLTGARRCDDQRALAKSDRREQFEHPHADRSTGRGKLNRLDGIDRSRFVERRRRLPLSQRDLVNRFDFEFGTAAILDNFAGDQFAAPQPDLGHHIGRDIRIDRLARKVLLGIAQLSIAALGQFEHAQRRPCLLGRNHRRRRPVVLTLRPTTVPALAMTSIPALLRLIAPLARSVALALLIALAVLAAVTLLAPLA